ncbi:hypothetical protein D3C83_127950 [compost metagenome]
MRQPSGVRVYWSPQSATVCATVPGFFVSSSRKMVTSEIDQAVFSSLRRKAKLVTRWRVRRALLASRAA